MRVAPRISLESFSKCAFDSTAVFGELLLSFRREKRRLMNGRSGGGCEKGVGR